MRSWTWNANGALERQSMSSVHFLSVLPVLWEVHSLVLFFATGYVKALNARVHAFKRRSINSRSSSRAHKAKASGILIESFREFLLKRLCTCNKKVVEHASLAAPCDDTLLLLNGNHWFTETFVSCGITSRAFESTFSRFGMPRRRCIESSNFVCTK